eukprot:Anaeramoba_ignava/c21125_g1_i1.p1 GENE.c21125_g1_i1~~c21125_g1_i1.p1  ORF type:complete len:1008 (-),score=328.49 c21125_g1_i1:190-3213(-)
MSFNLKFPTISVVESNKQTYEKAKSIFENLKNKQKNDEKEFHELWDLDPQGIQRVFSVRSIKLLSGMSKDNPEEQIKLIEEEITYLKEIITKFEKVLEENNKLQSNQKKINQESQELLQQINSNFLEMENYYKEKKMEELKIQIEQFLNQKFEKQLKLQQKLEQIKLILDRQSQEIRHKCGAKSKFEQEFQQFEKQMQEFKKILQGQNEENILSLERKIQQKKQEMKNTEEEKEQKSQAIKEMRELQKSIIPISSHFKEEWCNQIGLVENRFLFSPKKIKALPSSDFIPILIRKKAQILMNMIMNSSPSKNNGSFVIVTGVSGAGKSFLLFHLACFFAEFTKKTDFSSIHPQDPQIINQNEEHFQITNELKQNQNQESRNSNENRKVIVVYLARLEKLRENENYEVAKKIMEDLYNRYGSDFFSILEVQNFDVQIFTKKDPSDEEKENTIKICRTVLGILLTNSDPNLFVIFIIDEFNILFRKHNQKDHILDILLKHYQNTNISMILSCHSSFNTSKFGEKGKIYEESKFKLNTYNKNEFEVMIEWSKRLGGLPSEMKEEEIREFTSCVPRVLSYLTDSYENQKIGTDERVSWIREAEKSIISVYQKELDYIVKKFYPKNNENQLLIPSEKNSQFKLTQTEQNMFQGLALLAASMCLNRPIWDLSEIWQTSGLFFPVETDLPSNHISTQNQHNIQTLPQSRKYLPISKWVRDAFFKFGVQDEFWFIKLLLMLDHIGEALEMFVLYAFNKQADGIPLSLNNIDLTGKERGGIFQLTIKETIYQEYGKPLDNLSIGTFVILYKFHPVIDFVLLTESNGKKQLFYIQVSKLTYDQHTMKVDNLISSQIQDPINPKKKVSVLKYYSDLAKMDPPINDSELKTEEIEQPTKKGRHRKKETQKFNSNDKSEEKTKKSTTKYKRKDKDSKKRLTKSTQKLSRKKIQEKRKIITKLPPNHYYLYLTPNPNFLSADTKYAADDVILLNGNNFFSLDIFSSWLFHSYFTETESTKKN